MAVEYPLGDTLRQFRKRQRLTREELMGLAEVSYSWLTAIETGKDGRGGRPAPSPSILKSIARGLATDPLAGGIDQSQEEDFYDRLMEAAGYSQPGPPRMPTIPGGYQAVPHARTKAAAGRYVIEPTQAGAIAVEDSFASGRDLVQVTVTGDCLKPDIEHGEVVVFDRSRKDPRPGDFVIALTPEGELMVKRFDINSEGPLLSDNLGNEWRPNGTTIEGVVVAAWRRF